MSDSAIACRHGRLARACNECFLEKELAVAGLELRREMAANEKLRESFSSFLKSLGCPDYLLEKCMEKLDAEAEAARKAVK